MTDHSENHDEALKVIGGFYGSIFILYISAHLSFYCFKNVFEHLFKFPGMHV